MISFPYISVLVGIGGLCWGSFLNMVAYRSVHGNFEKVRSFCPQCQTTLVWYDLVPVISYLWLRGVCRTCRSPIPIGYPITEIATALLMIKLWAVVGSLDFLTWRHAIAGFGLYTLFMSSLIIAIKTDLDAMVIPITATLGVVPFGLFGAFMGVLPLSFMVSASGGLIGFGLLWLINKAFQRFRGIEGVGEGDMDLLCLIGVFLGYEGVHTTLLLASLSGLIGALIYLLATKKELQTRIPFAPFLAGSALICLLCPEQVRIGTAMVEALFL